MNSLVIGGTSSLGRLISEELILRSADITTISRANDGFPKMPHFQCDVLDREKLSKILNKVRCENIVIDNIWCVAGYAFPRKIDEQTPDIYRRHLDRNVTYVQLTLTTLLGNLKNSQNPLVVTFGSQWSYRSKEDFPELAPYAEAKRKLREYTRFFAMANSGIRANHYCIPSSDTFAMSRITDTLAQMNRVLPLSNKSLAKPEIVARGVVGHALNFEYSGKTLMCAPNGEISFLT